MNSHDNPLRVDWIEDHLPRWPGRLGLTIAPGKKGRGTDLHHNRDLATDFHTLRAAGVTQVVNLMEPDEMRRWQMHDYHPAAARAGLNVTHFPIADVSVPRDPAAFDALVRELQARLHGGDTVVVHCLGGLGRSGMLAACLLVHTGITAEDAIALVRRCRSPKAVEAAQPQFVHAYAETVTRAAAR